jgi:hypothetical protein
MKIRSYQTEELEPRTNQTEGNEGNEVSRKLEKIGIFASFAIFCLESFCVFRGQIACSATMQTQRPAGAGRRVDYTLLT